MRIQANTHSHADGTITLDVRGQTCPGYLLAINQAMEQLEPGTKAQLLIDYPPCSDDVRAWCDSRGYFFLECTPHAQHWGIWVQK
jgi:TusA-related sulfurtransferase